MSVRQSPRSRANSGLLNLTGLCLMEGWLLCSKSFLSGNISVWLVYGNDGAEVPG